MAPSLHADEEIPKSESENTAGSLEEGQLNKARVRELCYALQRIARLRRETTRAGIEARQKHREVNFKRQEVWVSDAKFMEEVQQLTARGTTIIYGELSQLANECQRTRNLLGPVEQESIEAEQRWEGLIWKLRHAEENLYIEFKDEFETAEKYSTASPSVASSPYRSSSDIGSRTSAPDVPKFEPHRPYYTTASVVSASSLPPDFAGADVYSDFDQTAARDSNFLGLDAGQTDEPTSHEYEIDWGSEVADIDRALTRSPPPFLLGQVLPLPEGANSKSLSLLLTDFTTTRDRVDKWIEHTMLTSRFEAMSLVDILRSKFEEEDRRIPSNWAQLTIAYWELKGDPETSRREHVVKNTAERDGNGDISMSAGKTYHEPAMCNLHPPDPPYVQTTKNQNTGLPHSDQVENLTALRPGAVSPFSQSTVLGSPRSLVQSSPSFDRTPQIQKGPVKYEPP